MAKSLKSLGQAPKTRREHLSEISEALGVDLRPCLPFIGGHDWRTYGEASLGLLEWTAAQAFAGCVSFDVADGLSGLEAGSFRALYLRLGMGGPGCIDDDTRKVFSAMYSPEEMGVVLELGKV